MVSLSKIDRMPQYSANKQWHVRGRKYNLEWKGPLIASWEAHLDPISDNYTPDEIDASELFHLWSKKVQIHHPDGLIPIHWFVGSPGHGKFERMPFQYVADRKQGEFIEDFLTFYYTPVDTENGDSINWLLLPVYDKLWNNHYFDKGGFIQEATGWKPNTLQPYVYLPSLESALT